MLSTRWNIVITIFLVRLIAATASAAEPITGFSTEQFTSALVCSHCHNGLIDRTGTDVSIVDDWTTSMMAFSFIDPYWQAKIASEIARAPGMKDIITEKCSRCHAPMAHTQSVSDGQNNVRDIYNFVRPNNPYHDAAGEGVGCTLCHQVNDSPILGSTASFTGKYASTLTRGRIYGQYSGVLTRPMVRMTGFLPLYGKQMHQARICGTCHNLKTPYVNRAGQLVSTPSTEFPEQAVYTEWEQSDYGEQGATPVTCQECHMPTTGGVILATRPPWLDTLRDRFSRHTFYGANTMIRELILRNGLAEGTPADRLQQNLIGVRHFLSSAATLTLVECSLKGGTLTAQLAIQNRTGHKLPTGFPSRRLIVHYVVRDEQGQVIFESGKTSANSLQVVGVDADSGEFTFEPHYNVITKPEQVQVYEGIMGNTEGQVTYTLLRGARFLKDNRLLPAGFVKERVPMEVRPTSEALADTNFVGGQDLVTYVVGDLKGKCFTVTAELVYQTISYRFLEHLLEDQHIPPVATFISLLQHTPPHQEIIARIERTLSACSQQ